MGGFYKRCRVISVLQRLQQVSNRFLLKKASKENYLIKPLSGSGRPFPLAANHSKISKFIMEKLGKLLEEWGVCTRDEFLDQIK